MSIHDPESKNNASKDINTNNQTQLIDDEIYEGEEDYEPNEATMVVTDNSILDSTGGVGDTISITLDPQTHQDLINEQVMLVVVPNSEAGGATSTNGQTIVTMAPTTSTPRIISRSGRVTRSLTKNNGN